MPEPTWPKPWPSIDESLADAITALDQANINAASEGELADVARRLDTAKRIIAIAKQVIAFTEARLTDKRDGLTEPIALAGVGVVVVEDTLLSAWRTKDSGAQFREDFAEAVVRQVATDVATREIDPMKRNIARATLHVALGAMPAIQGLKKGAAKSLGLAMGDYRTYDTGRKVVVMPVEHTADTEAPRTRGNVLGLDDES